MQMTHGLMYEQAHVSLSYMTAAYTTAKGLFRKQKSPWLRQEYHTHAAEGCDSVQTPVVRTMQ